MNSYLQALNEQKALPHHLLKDIGDQWRTPDPLFWGINAMFGPLVLDLFTDGENSKCPAFYTVNDNALIQDWSARLAGLNGAAFGNPPYSRPAQHDGVNITGMVQIISHTLKMRDLGGRYVFLIKAATSETWWPEDADHIAFIRGRVGFDAPFWFKPKDKKQVPTGAFFAGAIVIFDKSWRGEKISYISRAALETQGEMFMAQIRREAEKMATQCIPKNIPGVIQLPETENKVWPEEVTFIFGQLPDAIALAEPLQLKIKHHINRLKLDGFSTTEIITTAGALVSAMGVAA